MTDEQIAWLAESVPGIPPVDSEAKRPFWSVVIPTHNRHDLLPISLSSVLDQALDLGDMEIEVMDDASADSQIETVVRDLGRGRVSYHRQPRNVGQFANVNDGIRRARGHWIHVLHDDDWVRPGFYDSLRRGISEYPSAGAALTAFTLADSSGRESGDWPLERPTAGLLDDWPWKLSTSARIQTPAVVVRRDVYERLGGYNPDFPWPGDWEMWIRIASHYPWLYQPDARACYRNNETSVSSKAKRTGSNIADVRKAISFLSHYQPDESRERIRAAALRFWATFSLRTALNMIKQNDYDAAANQIRECLATESSKYMVLMVIDLAKHLK